MEKSKNSTQEINKNFQNELQNKKEEEFEIIIELEIFNNKNETEINILCDKNKLIENNKLNKDFYEENNINAPKEFNYFNKKNTKLYLNNNEIEFNYKLIFNKSGIYKLKIKSNIKLFSLASMFYNCNKINKIKFIKINTNNVTDMSYMFYNCEYITELDLSEFNTNKVLDMSSMFSDCYNLSDLNLSSFNTNNVKDMSYMFYKCKTLTKVDLSLFNTNNVIKMSEMFCYCYYLHQLDLSSFNTNNVTDMKYMFYNCFSLNRVLINKINIKNIKELININYLKV